MYFASTEIPIRSDQERLWCCSQPPAASLEGKLFALTGFTLHQEPAGETHPQLPKPAANSTLRTANSSSKAQPVKKKKQRGPVMGLAPAPSPPPGPSCTVLCGPDQQCLWLCVQGRGSCSLQPHMCQKMSQTQIWPRGVQGDSLRQIHLPPTDRWTGPSPFCEHCYILSPAQRPGTHGQTAGEASNPILFLTLPPPPTHSDLLTSWD